MPTDDFRRELVKYMPVLTRTARSMTRNGDLAEDLASATFMLALQIRDRFIPGSDMGAWLYTLQDGIHRNLKRRMTTRQRRETDADASLVGYPASQETTVYLYEILRLMSTLPEPQRTALHLVSQEQLTYKEVARKTNERIGTVKSRVARARAALLKAIDEPSQSREAGEEREPPTPGMRS